MLGVLSGSSLQGILERLPAPIVENDFMDHEESGRDLEHHLIPADPRRQNEPGEHCGDELGLRGKFGVIYLLIAENIRAGSYLYLTGLSLLPIVAVSLYMASRLMG